MRERDDDALSPLLDQAVRVLREEVTVTPEWRAAVLRELEAPAIDGVQQQRPLPLRTARQVSLRGAIAAALACLLVGSGATLALLRARERTVAEVAIAQRQSEVRLLPVQFSVVAPTAATVSIVGDFNHWNPTALPMHRSADGRTWEVEVRLPTGHYSYAYLIDGRIAQDPAAPRGSGDDFGEPNSVLMVKGS